MRKLEIASLAADLRAHQRLAAVIGIAEPGRRPVALDQPETLVERRARHARTPFDDVAERRRDPPVRADHQCFFLGSRMQPVLQPGNPRIRLGPAVRAVLGDASALGVKRFLRRAVGPGNRPGLLVE